LEDIQLSRSISKKSVFGVEKGRNFQIRTYEKKSVDIFLFIGIRPVDGCLQISMRLLILFRETSIYKAVHQ